MGMQQATTRTQMAQPNFMAPPAGSVQIGPQGMMRGGTSGTQPDQRTLDLLAMAEDKKRNWNTNGDLSENESEQIMNIINKEGDRELSQLQQSMQYTPNAPSSPLGGAAGGPDGGEQMIDGGTQ